MRSGPNYQKQMAGIKKARDAAYQREVAQQYASQMAALLEQCESFDLFLKKLQREFYDIYAGKDYIEHIEAGQKLLNAVSELAADYILELDEYTFGTLGGCSRFLSVLLEHHADRYQPMLRVVAQLVAQFATFRTALDKRKPVVLVNELPPKIDAVPVKTQPKGMQDLPQEVLTGIFDHLSIIEALKTSTVSKNFLTTAYDSVLRKTGAKSYEEFHKEVIVLPELLQDSILNEQYGLVLAKDIQDALSLSQEHRLELLKSLDTNSKLSTFTPEVIGLLRSDPGIVMLFEELLPFDYPAMKPDLKFLTYLFNDTNIIKLREKLITHEQILSIKIQTLLLLLSSNKISTSVFVDKVITLEEVDRLVLTEYYFRDGDNERWCHDDQTVFRTNRRDVRSLIDKLSKNIWALSEKSKNISQASPEAFAFIREQLVIYSRSDMGYELLAGVARFFTGFHSHHGDLVAKLLLKDEYARFDKKTFEDFIAELKNIVDFKTVSKKGTLYAILTVAKKLTQIDFHTIAAKDVKLEAAIVKRHD